MEKAVLTGRLFYEPEPHPLAVCTYDLDLILHLASIPLGRYIRYIPWYLGTYLGT